MILILSIAVFAACGDGRTDPEITAEPTPTPAETPSPTPTPAPTPEPIPLTDHALVGTWYWMESPYYVFEADGSGTMVGQDINWLAENGVLAICITPDLCRGNCNAPAEWYYVLDRDQLDLTSRVVPDTTFTYTRR